MPTLTVDGTPLHYRDEGQGPAVLLFHPFPLHSDVFTPQVRALSHRYRFLLPDARGFGRSAPGEGPTEMSRLARDGLAILDALGVESAVVGGVSMGGFASLALLREDAGRVRALVLVDTQADADDEAGRAHREALAAEALREGFEPGIRAMLPRMVAAGADSSVGREVAAFIRAAQPESFAAALRGMARRPDNRDILARYAGPVLVVVGEQDAITPPEKARQLAKLSPGSRLEVIPGAAHLPHLEQPEAFNAALDAFLSSL